MGVGRPILMLHGLMLDHRAVLPLEAVFAKRAGWRRIYIDLPGMGQSPCGDIANSDDMLAAIKGFIAREIEGPFAVFGYSYGGYLGQGLVATGAEVTGLGRWHPWWKPTLITAACQVCGCWTAQGQSANRAEGLGGNPVGRLAGPYGKGFVKYPPNLLTSRAKRRK